MFAEYRGTNQGLATLIHDFRHSYDLILKPTVRNNIRRLVINVTESKFIHVLLNAFNGDDYDKRWLAANRIEIDEVFQEFNRLRTQLGARPPEIQRSMMEANNNFADVRQSFGRDEVVASSSRATAALYGAVVGSTATTATALSAFSFFGGPIIGSAVTGTTAVSGAAATGAAAVYGNYIGTQRGAEQAEEIIRNEFRP